jgi:uncharacterized membrane protein YbhN (UPF0104 family)
LVLSGLFLVGDILLRALIWRELLHDLGDKQRVPFAPLAKIFAYSWIGRYVPGKIAYVVGRLYLGRSLGPSFQTLVGSIAYETVLFLVASCALVSLTLLPSLAAESESFLPYLVLPFLAVAGVAVVQRPILRRGLRVALRVLGREEAEANWLLPPRRIAKIICLCAAVFCLSGMGFYLLVLSLTPYSARYIPLAVGAFTLASVAGMFSIFVPAGIGVREGLLVSLLQFTMPVELAIMVSLVARVWATAVDLLLVGGSVVHDQISGDRIIWTAFSGRERADASGGPTDSVDP